MPTWPGSLPQSFLLGGFGMQKQPTAIRSETSYGPNIQRKRFSAGHETVTGKMHMTGTQWDTVTSFKDSTLNEGIATFDWTHPVTGLAATVRFIADKPDCLQIMSNMTGDLYLVQLKMEFLA